MTEGYSLGAQRDAITAHCARQDWPEPAWFVEDGHTAIHDDPDRRPVFRQLLAAAEARAFDTLLVIDIDRFTRSVVAGLTAAGRFERCGVRVISLNQPGDFTTPDGEMSFTLHAMVAPQLRPHRRARPLQDPRPLRGWARVSGPRP
jgi:DNA invertase Pin-like site-specific DNA recombinase